MKVQEFANPSRLLKPVYRGDAGGRKDHEDHLQSRLVTIAMSSGCERQDGPRPGEDNYQC